MSSSTTFYNFERIVPFLDYWFFRFNPKELDFILKNFSAFFNNP